ncbi:MAG: four helix bundle protein [Verrucomicrobia bacterium]|nr:four helix bundle protein [Verrucomicrobiota bacterium]
MQDLAARTFEFALRITKLVARLPNNRIADVHGRQLLRAGTSVGANWQEATAASSRADFVYRVEVCEREARESNYWLRLIEAAMLPDDADVKALKRESEELVAILTTIGKKSKAKR